MSAWPASGRCESIRESFVSAGAALLLLRSICWATMTAGGLMASFIWLASTETSISRELRNSLFMVMWGLAFVPSLAAELLNAHLGAELGNDNRRAEDESRP